MDIVPAMQKASINPNDKQSKNVDYYLSLKRKILKYKMEIERLKDELIKYEPEAKQWLSTNIKYTWTPTEEEKLCLRKRSYTTSISKRFLTSHLLQYFHEIEPNKPIKEIQEQVSDAVNHVYLQRKKSSKLVVHYEHKKKKRKSFK